MRRLRIGYACALTAGLAGPMALVACGTDDTADPVSTPTGTVTTPATTGSTSIPTPSVTRATTPKPLPETGPEPGYDRTAFGQSTTVDNKWFPLRPGTRLVYRGQTIEDGERVAHSVTFIVTNMTKVIDGVRTVVIWERDYKDGVLEEAELALFAQADDGKVWHFGQYPEVFENGKVVESLAWIHGIKGAQAGITIKAKPELGARSYSQGWGPAVGWSDRAKVHQVGQRTCVAAGCFKDVLVTDEFSLDEPGAHQLKYYAPGVGTVRVGYYGNDPTQETLELVSSTRLSNAALAQVRAEVLKMEKRAYQRSKDVYGLTARAS
jgi:hypothetical protein